MILTSLRWGTYGTGNLNWRIWNSVTRQFWCPRRWLNVFLSAFVRFCLFLPFFCELDDLFTIASLSILKIHYFIIDYCPSVRVCPCWLLVSLFISSIISSLQSYLLTHHFILIVCVLFVPWFTRSAMLCNCWSYNLPIFLYLQVS